MVENPPLSLGTVSPTETNRTPRPGRAGWLGVRRGMGNAGTTIRIHSRGRSTLNTNT